MTDAGSWVYYKLTYEPLAQVSLNAIEMDYFANIAACDLEIGWYT